MKFHKNQVPWRACGRSVISQCSKYLWETSPAHTRHRNIWVSPPCNRHPSSTINIYILWHNTTKRHLLPSSTLFTLKLIRHNLKRGKKGSN